mgnify:CR=1 FL=1
MAITAGGSPAPVSPTVTAMKAHPSRSAAVCAWRAPTSMWLRSKIWRTSSSLRAASGTAKPSMFRRVDRTLTALAGHPTTGMRSSRSGGMAIPMLRIRSSPS